MKNPRKLPGKFLLQPSQKPYLRYNVSLSVAAIFLVEQAVTWLPASLCNGGQCLRLLPGLWVEEEEAGKRTPYNGVGCFLSSVADVGAKGEGVLRGGGGKEVVGLGRELDGTTASPALWSRILATAKSSPFGNAPGTSPALLVRALALRKPIEPERAAVQ